MLKNDKNTEPKLDKMTERDVLIQALLPLLDVIPMQRLRALYIKALVASRG